jgi:hypothetical protein
MTFDLNFHTQSVIVRLPTNHKIPPMPYYGYSSHYYKTPFYKTKGFYILLVLIFAIVGFVYWSIKRVPSDEINIAADQNASQAQIISKIILAEGTVKIKTETADWTDAAVDAQVTLNSSVKTDAKSRAIIELPDKSQIRLAENSEIRLNDATLTDIVIEQVAGQTFHRVKEETSAIYKVKLENIELTALGTGFDVAGTPAKTALTVTANQVKVKIYKGDDIINIRTVDTGTVATIDPALVVDKMISVKETSSGDLLENDWFAWNLEKDRGIEAYLGLFEKAVALEISDPSKTEFSTDQEKLTIKGKTDPKAEVFIDGKELDNNDGVFQTIYELKPGENQIKVSVKVDKNRNQKTLLVTNTKTAAKLTLSAEKISDTKVKLSWKNDGVGNVIKFVSMQSNQNTLDYPNNAFHLIGAGQTADEWSDLAAGIQYFRVCAITSGDKCGAYSDPVSVSLGGGASIEDAAITLSAAKTGGAVNLKWTIANLTNFDGFITVVGLNANPVYPGSSNHPLLQGARSDSWKNLSAGAYHFRVCATKGNQCLKYSNDVSVSVSEEDRTSIVLNGYSSGGKANLSWTSGFASAKGFKVIVSDASGVAFPGSSHHLVLSSTATSDSWENLEKGKTYYFRVCENLGSSCGIYSNEISLVVR